MKKKVARIKRALKSRSAMRLKKTLRLCVYRSPRHIYAQIINEVGDKVLVSASTVEAQFKELKMYSGNVSAAQKVGSFIAQRAKESGIERVAFDRSGYRYHGRVKALADAAREAGLVF
tara:strand:+ start:126 stop:479 length:354 start_codon:yes stop_codon:yes gene_type:complete